MLVLKDGNKHNIIGAEVFIEELHLIKKTDKYGCVRFEKLCDKRCMLNDIPNRQKNAVLRSKLNLSNVIII